MLMTLISIHTALYISLCFAILIVNKLLLSSPVTMISFCRKSVHSLLSFTTTTTTTTNSSPSPSASPIPMSRLGLIGLISDEGPDPDSNENVWAAASVPKAGGIGFAGEERVSGLTSCTEGLGFESSDDGGGDSFQAVRTPESRGCDWKRSRRRTAAGERRFPPPLPSLDWNGKPSFFLRPVRRDGRLELTEVRIRRPEILRAYRGDGRLRLQFVGDLENDHDHGNDNDNLGCIEEEEEEQEKEELVSSDQGFRRCHEEVNSQRNHHHHHRNELWRSQHCVSTR